MSERDKSRADFGERVLVLEKALAQTKLSCEEVRSWPQRQETVSLSEISRQVGALKRARRLIRSICTDLDYEDLSALTNVGTIRSYCEDCETQFKATLDHEAFSSVFGKSSKGEVESFLRQLNMLSTAVAALHRLVADLVEETETDRSPSESAEREACASEYSVRDEHPQYMHWVGESRPPAYSEVELPPGGSDTRRDKLLESRRYTVWYGTDRLLGADAQWGSDYTCDHARRLSLGACTVYVPRTHKYGAFGSNWVARKVLKKLLGREEDHLQLESANQLSRDQFTSAITQELVAWQKKTALIVIPGYNHSFEQAAIRTAQIGWDLRVDGISAFYSWSSKGRILGYVPDMAAIELAEPHFVDFVQAISAIPGLEEIHILAHSMGNQLLVRTVRDLLAAKSDGRLKAPIGHIVLAAADVSADLFRNYADIYADLAAKRLTNYASDKDRALGLSATRNEQSTVGRTPPIFVCNRMDTICVTDLDMDFLGHGYYAEAKAVLYDIAELIRHNTQPSDRLRMEERTDTVPAHWALTA